MSAPLVAAHDVWLEYPDAARHVTALRGVSLAVAPGDTVGIMGPSGSGKSSLLLALAGLRPPTRGQVTFAGTAWPASPAASAPVRRRRIGFVFQEPCLVHYLTLRENVRLQAVDRAAAARIAPLADRLGIAALLDVRPERLSMGERQRGGILRALVNAPDLVIADEPTSSLDHDNALRVMQLLWGAAGPAAVIACSHDPRMLERAAVRHVLEDGVLAG
jgi:putative ABC transport system ATP-binding protein